MLAFGAQTKFSDKPRAGMSQYLNSLLSELADARFHSGDKLGAALGISRGAVWKLVHRIRELGLEVHTVKGKGYRLAEPLTLLQASLLRGHMDKASLSQLGELEILLTVDSTNAHALGKLQKGRLDLGGGRFYVCFAEQQTAGRGRRGRQWVSPFGHNLYLSLVRQFDSGMTPLEGLSLVVGLAVLRVLQAQGLTGLGLKWPNDVLWNGRKLAGVLLEMTGDLMGECQLVIGIGLNVKMPRQSAVTAGIDQPWADLAQALDTLPDRNVLAACLLQELFGMLRIFERQGFAAFREEWQRHDALLGEAVVLRSSFEKAAQGLEGICRGLDDKGGLVLETASGLQTFYGGELSLRRLDQ